MVIKKKRKLTLKQEKFINEVMISGNATDAAMKVYKCKSRTVAKSVWPENLAKPCIKAEIEDRVQIAKDKVFELVQKAKKEDTQLRAAQDIIDRVDWKATIKIGWDDWLPFTVNIVNYGNKTDTDPA